jgi:hypothetical protein
MLSAINVVDTTYSGMCVNCHTCDPSTYTASNAYTANGTASHYVCGDVTAAGFGARTTGTTAIRYAGTGTSATPTINWLGSGLPSKFGANATTMICESCHRLAAGNLIGGDGATAMLVEVSGRTIETTAADATVAATDYSGKPYLCTGCHLVPAGTHPLSNAVTATYPIASNPLPTGQSYVTSPAGMNCESCHSSHDADTDSGSYILDGGGTGTVTGGMEVEPPIDYTDFCAVCHTNFK